MLLAALAFIGAGCSDESARPPTFRATPGDQDKAWLAQIGTGAAQTERACAGSAVDPIARELCRSPRPSVKSLVELYAVLGVAPDAEGDVAVTTHSLGLSARTVSDVNPRTIVFRHYSPLDEHQIAAVAFSRGAPYVELVGYDPLTHDFNFYLLAVRPACEGRKGALGNCTARDLLTERIETGWVDWTLYTEADLEDTPLDCRSCHRPDGAGTPARLLMRQLDSPWLHWGDFRSFTLPRACTTELGSDAPREILADGADILLKLDGADGRHGGVPVADLLAAKSGYDLSSFLFYSAGSADGIGDVPCELPLCAYSEPLPFASRDVLCDLAQYGRADIPGGAWDTYRNLLLSRGLPVPYFEHHILAEPTRAAIADDFDAFVAGAPPHRDDDDAFTRLSQVVTDETARSIGFLPDDSDSAEQILTKMCVRCHGANVDVHLGRSRFRATALGELDPSTAGHVLERISLPRTSPYRMPPLLSGDLPDWAIARIEEFLAPLMASGRANDRADER
jgi:hypothetical protein